MLSIGQFFKKIQGRHARETLIRSAIKDALNKQAGVEADIGAISCKSGTVTVSGLSQAARSQIFIKKQQIIQEANTLQNLERISDIR